MSRFNIRRRIARRALAKADQILTRLDPPAEAENWILYKITQAAAHKIILPVMVRWPWKTGLEVGAPPYLKLWRGHMAMAWKGVNQSWSEGTYMVMFGGPLNRNYGVHFGRILKGEGDQEDGYGFLGSNKVDVQVRVVRPPSTTIH